jgi:hypothetical protein
MRKVGDIVGVDWSDKAAKTAKSAGTVNKISAKILRTLTIHQEKNSAATLMSQLTGLFPFPRTFLLLKLLPCFIQESVPTIS